MHPNVDYTYGLNNFSSQELFTASMPERLVAAEPREVYGLFCPRGSSGHNIESSMIAPASRPMSWFEEPAPPEIHTSASPSGAPWTFPAYATVGYSRTGNSAVYESSVGVMAPRTALHMGNSLPASPSTAWRERRLSSDREPNFSAGPSKTPWPLPNVELEHSWGSSPTIPSPLAFLTEPSIPYTGYDEYSQPVVAQEYCADSVLAVNYVPYRYPSPVSNRGDQYFPNVNVNRQITTSSNPFDYEGIVTQNNKFGLPTSSGRSSTSDNGTGNSTPHTLLVQRDAAAIAEESGSSRGKGKRKRLPEDSPEEGMEKTQSSKQVCRHDPQEPARMMGDQQTPTCSTRPNVHHRPRRSQSGQVKKTAKMRTMGTQFIDVTGITDSGGHVKMGQRKQSAENSNASAHAQVPMHPIAQVSQRRDKIEIKADNMAVDCMLLNRKQKAKRAREEGILGEPRKRNGPKKQKKNEDSARSSH